MKRVKLSVMRGSTLSKRGTSSDSLYKSSPTCFQPLMVRTPCLKSEQALDVSIQIIRSFISLRQVAMKNEELARRVTDLEGRSDSHSKAILALIEALEKPSKEEKKRIGFSITENARRRELLTSLQAPSFALGKLPEAISPQERLRIARIGPGS